jgi:hypothetical protein
LSPNGVDDLDVARGVAEAVARDVPHKDHEIADCRL